jgi:hypothetical protein
VRDGPRFYEPIKTAFRQSEKFPGFLSRYQIQIQHPNPFFGQKKPSTNIPSGKFELGTYFAPLLFHRALLPVIFLPNFGLEI